MNHPEDYVAIIGAGPAGCTLACLLAMRGMKPIVFDDEKRPDLLVGESLIPAAIPILRKIGIEDQIKEISSHKPGASFFHTEGLKINFSFQERNQQEPGYAYNVPRPQFDDIIKKRAQELGVQFIKSRVKISRESDSTQNLKIDQASLDLAGLSQQPRWMIDASGRARVIARALDLSSKKGPRKDAAYFAHFENFDHSDVVDGQIIISVLEKGWSWRIPIKDKLSVGIVIDHETAKKLGSSPEERLLKAIQTEPLLKQHAKNARQVSKVMTYTNYQITSEQCSGPNWVLLGDAYGFVDPMLSPGLFMAMESARLLDQSFFAKGIPSTSSQKQLEQYKNAVDQWHEAWSSLIEYFYDGRLMSLYEAGESLNQQAKKFSLPKMMEKIVSTTIARMAAGSKTRSPVHQKILHYSAQHLAWEVNDPDFYKIKR